MIDPGSVRAVLEMMWDNLWLWVYRNTVEDAVNYALTLPVPTSDAGTLAAEEGVVSGQRNGRPDEAVPGQER